MRDVLLGAALFGGALFAMWLPLGLVWLEGAAVAALVSVPITAFVAAASAPGFAARVRAAPVRRRGEKARRLGAGGGVRVLTIAYALSVAVLAVGMSWPLSPGKLADLPGVYLGMLLLGVVVWAAALPGAIVAGRVYADRVQYARAPEPLPARRETASVDRS